MAIPFSRSLRSLQNDSSRLGLVALAALLVILLAWLIWFFTPSLPRLESSRQVEVKRDGTLIVRFAPAHLGEIQPGQKAGFKPASQAVEIEGMVSDIDYKSGDISLFLFTSEKIKSGASGEAWVQTGHLSPAMLVSGALAKTSTPSAPLISGD